MANKAVSNFALPVTDGNGKDLRLPAVKSKWVVLYFYPKDNTPGQEVLDFVKAV